MSIPASKRLLSPFTLTLIGAYAVACLAGGRLNRTAEIPGTSWQQSRRISDFGRHSGMIARSVREGRRVVLALGQSRFEASIEPALLDSELNSGEADPARYESYNLGVRFAYVEHLQLVLREARRSLDGAGPLDTLVIEASPAMLTRAFGRNLAPHSLAGPLLPLFVRGAHRYADTTGISFVRTASIMAIDPLTLEQLAGFGGARMLFSLWKRTPSDPDLYWDPSLHGGTPYLARYTEPRHDDSWIRTNDMYYRALERTMDISDLDLDPARVTALESLLTEATGIARRVIFLHSPVAGTWYRRRSAAGQANLVRLLGRLGSIPGVKVVDLTAEFEKDENFIDLFHLNRAASRAFNRRIAALVRGR